VAYSVHYLVDGGYVNNLPADVMKQVFGVRTVIAVDVSGEWTMKGIRRLLYCVLYDH
jgi:predicted acylesterase/phospholipase RssA